jgi:hypothetical protein
VEIIPYLSVLFDIDEYTVYPTSKCVLNVSVPRQLFVYSVGTGGNVISHDEAYSQYFVEQNGAAG